MSVKKIYANTISSLAKFNIHSSSFSKQKLNSPQVLPKLLPGHIEKLTPKI